MEDEDTMGLAMPVSIVENLLIFIGDKYMSIDIESQSKEVVLSEACEQITRPIPLKRMLLAQRGFRVRVSKPCVACNNGAGV